MNILDKLRKRQAMLAPKPPLADALSLIHI